MQVGKEMNVLCNIVGVGGRQKCIWRHVAVSVEVVCKSSDGWDQRRTEAKSTREDEVPKLAQLKCGLQCSQSSMKQCLGGLSY
jgi:hypothetical protein